MPKATSDTLIYGWAALCAKLGRSRTQLWRDVRAGKFPAPLEVGSNAVAWRRSVIDGWIASRRRRTYGRGRIRLPDGEC
jgi:prophage regulatory protein